MFLASMKDDANAMGLLKNYFAEDDCKNSQSLLERKLLCKCKNKISPSRIKCAFAEDEEIAGNAVDFFRLSKCI